MINTNTIQYNINITITTELSVKSYSRIIEKKLRWPPRIDPQLFFSSPFDFKFSFAHVCKAAV